jgi:hypothetical protein
MLTSAGYMRHNISYGFVSRRIKWGEIADRSHDGYCAELHRTYPAEVCNEAMTIAYDHAISCAPADFSIVFRTVRIL